MIQRKQLSPLFIIRWIVSLLLLGSIAFLVRNALSNAGTRSICPRCNVIIITIDNLRADALPCYGYHLNTAPNICRFAGQSVVFSNAYANAAWTLPSEVSLFTGLYPTSHGIGRAMVDVLNPSVNTLPKVLQQNGYDTRVVTNIQANVGLEQGLSRGFDHVQFTEHKPKDAMPVFVKAIDAIKSANARRKPTFVFFHTDGVHDYLGEIPDIPPTFPLDPEYRPPAMPDDVNEFTPYTWEVLRDTLLFVMQTNPVRNATKRYTNWYERLSRAKTLAEAKVIYNELPREDQNEILWTSGNDKIRAALGSSYGPLSRHLYDEAVRTTDDYLGQVFTRLADNNLLRNTIIIITAEHGEYLGERGLFGHHTEFFDPEIHVPLVMYIPRVSGRRIDNLTALIDVYHTLFELLGINTNVPESSVSQVGAIRKDPKAPKRDVVISEWYQPKDNKSILSNEWHLLEHVRSGTVEQELYHRASDPEEVHNVIRDYPATADWLTNLLHTTLDRQPIYQPIPSSYPDWIDNQHRRKLIQTGYF